MHGYSYHAPKRYPRRNKGVIGAISRIDREMPIAVIAGLVLALVGVVYAWLWANADTPPIQQTFDQPTCEERLEAVPQYRSSFEEPPVDAWTFERQGGLK